MTLCGVTNRIRWQWSGYRATHQNKTNLLIHLIAVPLFMAATVMAVSALVSLSVSLLVASMLGLVLSLIMQRIGHQREPLQPEPFHGGVDFACRILIEQWITFPRYVLTGGWFNSLSQPGVEQKGNASTVRPPE